MNFFENPEILGKTVIIFLLFVGIAYAAMAVRDKTNAVTPYLLKFFPLKEILKILSDYLKDPEYNSVWINILLLELNFRLTEGLVTDPQDLKAIGEVLYPNS